MNEPTILELCAAEGGATRGYQQAGLRVIAVDIKDFSDVNPAEEFYVVDPDEPVADVIARFRHRVVAAHTSPPCQRWTHGNAANDVSHHPDLIAAHRAALTASGLPFTIENVPRAPLLDPVVLCGTMFDLRTVDTDGVELHLQRHRMFETNWGLAQPAHHHPAGVQWAGSYGGARRDKTEAREVRKGGYVPPRPVLDRLMGIDGMSEWGLFQALPPAYTNWIGLELRRAIEAAA